ncbi:hypothetical protein P4O66_000854 [Electrophorus voltai]|uniref:SKI/SNO/DAC domain-containing protein n=1 Tax=Electrophorus voltai TaxID=2609070 RepID=A0AAD8ZGI8_9TELE|nr:hypothetical protein P4O66_000854 [Electrophorus voltai]
MHQSSLQLDVSYKAMSIELLGMWMDQVTLNETQSFGYELLQFSLTKCTSVLQITHFKAVLEVTMAVPAALIPSSPLVQPSPISSSSATTSSPSATSSPSPSVAPSGQSLFRPELITTGSPGIPAGTLPSKPVYSTPSPVENTPQNNECKMVELRGAKVASFTVDGCELICLPQAFDLFLKHLVGGLHTVYTKLKRLEITPVVCNVEQVRILRGLGAIQPGVNRCKLISRKDFETLYNDCTNARASWKAERDEPPPAASAGRMMSSRKKRNFLCLFWGFTFGLCPLADTWAWWTGVKQVLPRYRGINEIQPLTLGLRVVPCHGFYGEACFTSLKIKLASCRFAHLTPKSPACPAEVLTINIHIKRHVGVRVARGQCGVPVRCEGNRRSRGEQETVPCPEDLGLHRPADKGRARARPQGASTLTPGSKHRYPREQVSLPQGASIVTPRSKYRYPREQVSLPQGASIVTPGSKYRYPREQSLLPKGASIVTPGSKHRYPREQVSLPQGASIVTPGSKYRYPKEQVSLPQGASIVTPGSKYRYPKEQVSLPQGASIVTPGSKYRYPREQSSLPKGASIVTPGSKHRYPREQAQLPQGASIIIPGSKHPYPREQAPLPQGASIVTPVSKYRYSREQAPLSQEASTVTTGSKHRNPGSKHRYPRECSHGCSYKSISKRKGTQKIPGFQDSRVPGSAFPSVPQLKTREASEEDAECYIAREPAHHAPFGARPYVTGNHSPHRCWAFHKCS